MDSGEPPNHVQEQQPLSGDAQTSPGGHQWQDAEQPPPTQSDGANIQAREPLSEPPVAPFYGSNCLSGPRCPLSRRPLLPPELDTLCYEGATVNDHKRKSFLRNVTGTPYLTAVTVGVSLLFVLALGACIAVLLRSQCPDEPAHAEDEAIRVENVKNSEVLPPCRDGWLGYLDKCYFFSEKEANWDDAKHVCASWNSSLAAIDNQREMDFVMRYKGEIDHWIGLRRDSGQAWKWVNGTEFSNWFIIGDHSECAFLGSFVGSSGCHSKHHWICTSKPFNNEKQTKRVCSFGALIY
ncbi:early activation antigen CD69-like isoform X1 [Ambystoma mexicanum]|uniref:early activation antigen CD69-like isoform X1 n=1 Tax=Ambystoma mexicanum TaxID=8296 RepID=UPI0037E916E1